LPIKSKQTNISHEGSGKGSDDKTLKNRNEFIRIQIRKPMLISLLQQKSVCFFLETTLCKFFSWD